MALQVRSVLQCAVGAAHQSSNTPSSQIVRVKISRFCFIALIDEAQTRKQKEYMTFVCVCIYIYTYVYIYIYIYIYLFVCIYVYIYVCMYICNCI